MTLVTLSVFLNRFTPETTTTYYSKDCLPGLVLLTLLSLEFNRYNLLFFLR